MDQEGEAVANGSYNLAFVILEQNGDMIKAEELAREAVRIRTLIHGNFNQIVGNSCNLLAMVLGNQKKLGDETKELFERSLAIRIRNEGPDGSNTATAAVNMGDYYYKLAGIQLTIDSKRTQLLLAKFHSEEAHRIYSKIYGPANPTTVDAASRLALVLSELSLI